MAGEAMPPPAAGPAARFPGIGRCARTRSRRSSRRPARTPSLLNASDAGGVVEPAELRSRRRIVHRPDHRLSRSAHGRQGPSIGRKCHVRGLIRHPRTATRLRATGSHSSIGPLPMIASRFPCGLNRISRVLLWPGRQARSGTNGSRGPRSGSPPPPEVLPAVASMLFGPSAMADSSACGSISLPSSSGS